MEILPIAFDSLGVRSTATFVETDKKILIDPGAALGPLRYGLPPSEIEFRKLDELLEKIHRYLKKSEIVTISHYHYDHYLPGETYKDKILLIKNPGENINYSQKGRAKDFINLINNSPKTIEFSDGRRFEFGETKISFSPPFPHGNENSKLGFVIICSISYKNKKLIHASDIQGPQVLGATDWIIAGNPDILILSGFPTIFIGWRISKKALEQANSNLIRILENTKTETIILDHHLVRDLNYRKKISHVLKAADKLNKRVITAAEFLGKAPEFLEARRRELYTSRDEI